MINAMIVPLINGSDAYVVSDEKDCTDIDTLITDICPVWSCDQLPYLSLCFPAERASYCVIHQFSCHIYLTSKYLL